MFVGLIVAGTDLVCVCRVWVVVSGTDLVHVCRVAGTWLL